MNINELGEDLEQQFGKVNENVEKPSLEAFGMTILAVMSYQTTPCEELANKPSIRKTLIFCLRHPKPLIILT